MKRFAQQFKKQSDKIQLTAGEQFLLRERITTFMEYHPLPARPVTSTETLSLNDSFVVIRVPWRKWRISFGMAVLAIFITLPAVAEYAVPGDVLYPVKVRINEEVRSTLARTPYEKVEWESKRIERRISEARVLAKAGLLTPEAEQAVAEAVTQHRINANAEIALLRENNNTDEVTLANMTLASVFEVHSTAFRADRENNDDDTTLATTSSAKQTLAGVLEGGRAELAILNETEVISYDRLMAELEKQTTRAYERLASIKKAASVQEVSDINRRLQDIATRIIEARGQIEEAGNSGTTSLRQALHDTKKLIAFMNDIDVRTTIAVESIVPITLTFAERKARLSPQVEALAVEINKIQQVTQSVSDSAIEEKVALYLPEVVSYIKKARTVNPETIVVVEGELTTIQEMIISLKEILVRAGADFTVEFETTDIISATSSEVVSGRDEESGGELEV